MISIGLMIQILVFLIIVIGGGLLARAYFVTARVVIRSQEEVLEQKQRIREAREKAVLNTPLVELIEASLNVLTERARLTMLLAQNRANKLFIIGVILMIVSVFAPVVSTFLYLNSNPLEFIEKVPSIEGRTFEVPIQRDWRILVSGISFGFLFLAAARGILKQEAQQRETYFKLDNRITYYENTITALKIDYYLQKKNLVQDNIKVAERILEQLLEPIIWDNSVPTQSRKTSEKETLFSDLSQNRI